MIGSELRSRRERMGLSQAELAARLGIPANTIARWERGEIKIEHSTVLRMALKHLELELEEEWQSLSAEEQYRRNQERQRRFRLRTEETLRQMTPEQREATEQWLDEN